MTGIIRLRPVTGWHPGPPVHYDEATPPDAPSGDGAERMEAGSI